MLFQRGIEVGDIGTVVLVVMDLHGLRVDVRLQRAEVIRERGYLVGHSCFLLGMNKNYGLQLVLKLFSLRHLRKLCQRA